MGLRCEDCFKKDEEAVVKEYEKYAAARHLKVTINDYEGKNKCGGCGKKKATKILSYS